MKFIVLIIINLFCTLLIKKKIMKNNNNENNFKECNLLFVWTWGSIMATAIIFDIKQSHFTFLIFNQVSMVIEMKKV